MIRSVTFTNYLGESIKSILARPEETGFAITSMTGLGPGKATINTTEIVTNDGSLFNSARLSSRNIVVSMKYLWNNTIEDTRQALYQYFPLKKTVNVLIETDNRMLEIDGYVESNDPTIFSKSEGSDVSIICPDPYFYAAGDNAVNKTTFGGVEPLFEFPFSNESLYSRLLIMGEIRDGKENAVVYNGDAEIGFTMTIHALGDASNITIYNTGTGESMKIDTNKLKSLTGTGFTKGDDIIICTVKGKKSVTLLRNSVTTNILNCLDKNADWFQLTKGRNWFTFKADSGYSHLQFAIEYRTIYEGV